jgi:hypothetical protein
MLQGDLRSIGESTEIRGILLLKLATRVAHTKARRIGPKYLPSINIGWLGD